MSVDTKKIVENAFIAAIYFVVTLICMPLSYGLIQFRVSELLMLLCFFRKDFVIGLTIGCFLSNLAGSGSVLGSSGWIDAFVGSAATLLSGLLMPYCKKLFIASLLPAIFNGLIVGAELTYLFEASDLYYVAFGYVFLGELVVVSIVGYIFFTILIKKDKKFLTRINATCNLKVKW